MNLRLLFILLLVFTAFPVQSEISSELKAFKGGSYQQLLSGNQGKPFILVLWSTTCTSCLKDMAIIRSLHEEMPKLKIVMLATDDVSEAEEVKSILKANNLTALDNWVFADDDSQRLYYEIDPKWYGELPRAYFFTANHERTGVSGALSKEQFLSRLHSIQP
ncbi:MAG: hypothetical protein CTY29_04355 [Methylobacter sp.]|nr:MAG: hypothetical protein CTY29_04355 [Methylobacter sp.]